MSANSSSGCPFASLVWILPYPLFRRCVYVIKDHRTTWILCGNPTARLVSKWYTVLCAPQLIVAPILAVVQHTTSAGSIWALIFGARVTSILAAGEIDKRYPYQRAIGLSHWMTFGPLWGWLMFGNKEIWRDTKPTDSLHSAFLWMQLRLMAVCLFLDARDLLFQMAGYPYPCFIREAVIAKKLKINKNDPRALYPVKWRNRIFGP